MTARTHGMRRIIGWILVISYVLVVATGVWVGVRIGQFQASLSEQEIKEMYEQYSQVKTSEQSLKTQAIKQQQLNDIDKKTIELLRQENKDILEQLAKIKEEISYYKRVVNPDKNAQGLVLGRMRIKPMDAKDEYEFTADLMQVSGGRSVTGHFSFTITGKNIEGQAIKLPLSSLNKRYSKKGIRVKFYNYHDVQGTFKLPESFTPIEIQANVNFVQGKKVKIKKTYPWPKETLSPD